MAYVTELVREDFPILKVRIQGRPLVYLDNAASTQKPLQVLDVSRRYYETMHSNIHRGTHHLARAATEAYEEARGVVAGHLGAVPEEVIFTSGATDGINLVASAVVRSGWLRSGDEVVVSAMEHHSNIVPWQMAAERVGAVIRVIPCDDQGVLDLEAYRGLLSERTKVVAVGWISNAFGTVHPVHELVRMARGVGAKVLVDGAQAAPHLALDVGGLGADFLVFSGHKVYAPTGTGVLWGRREVMEVMAPWRGGGEMIREVTFEKTTYNDLPFKYEAGTPNIEGAIALGAALRYVNGLGMEAIREHEERLIRRAAEVLREVKGVRLYGPEDRAGALSFGVEGVHHYDLGTLLDQMGVAVRTGHHCCQPLMARFGITGTTRASVGLYNTEEEIEVLGRSVAKAVGMLR